MPHRFFARDGLPLNPCQKLRNEPKASNPGVPQETKAELMGLRNLRNCSNCSKKPSATLYSNTSNSVDTSGLTIRAACSTDGHDIFSGFRIFLTSLFVFRA
jgi:hypothetical protein